MGPDAVRKCRSRRSTQAPLAQVTPERRDRPSGTRGPSGTRRTTAARGICPRITRRSGPSPRGSAPHQASDFQAEPPQFAGRALQKPHLSPGTVDNPETISWQIDEILINLVPGRARSAQISSGSRNPHRTYNRLNYLLIASSSCLILRGQTCRVPANALCISLLDVFRLIAAATPEHVPHWCPSSS